MVRGDPGIGKSRLIEEVRGHVAPAAVTWLEGRCVSFGGSTPYLPLRDPIVDALQLPRGEPVPRRRWPSGCGHSSPVISTTPSRTCRRCSGRSATTGRARVAGDVAVARAGRPPPVRPRAGRTRSGRDLGRGPPLGRRVHAPRAPTAPPGGPGRLAPVRPHGSERPRRDRRPDERRPRTHGADRARAAPGRSRRRARRRAARGGGDARRSARARRRDRGRQSLLHRRADPLARRIRRPRPLGRSVGGDRCEREHRAADDDREGDPARGSTRSGGAPAIRSRRHRCSDVRSRCPCSNDWSDSDPARTRTSSSGRACSSATGSRTRCGSPTR